MWRRQSPVQTLMPMSTSCGITVVMTCTFLMRATALVDPGIQGPVEHTPLMDPGTQVPVEHTTPVQVEHTSQMDPGTQVPVEHLSLIHI